MKMVAFAMACPPGSLTAPTRSSPVAVAGSVDSLPLAAADGGAVATVEEVDTNTTPYVTKIAAAKPAGSSQDMRDGGLSFTNWMII
jgi:hypothetical protein